MKVERSWGYYRVIEESPGYKLKEIVVYPGKCLSYQKHEERNELWFVKEGNGTVIIGDKAFVAEPHSIFTISVGEWHQLINGTLKELRVIETQFGNVCIEEDIERK